MRVVLTSAWRGYKSGDVLDLETDAARRLISLNLASAQPPPEVAEPLAVGVAEEPMSKEAVPAITKDRPRRRDQ